MPHLISTLLAFFVGIHKEMNEKLLFIKKHINLKNSFVTIVFVLISITNFRAQFCNATVASNETIVPTTTNQVTTTYNSGRRAFNFVATAGCTYYFETCGLSTSDTYLRLYATGTGGTVLATNDDFCGFQSAITWYCGTSGTYSVFLTRWGTNSCNALNANASLRYRLTGCVTPFDPCASIPTLSCELTTNYSMAGSAGAWNNYGGAFLVPGQEKLFAFTPTVTGVHNVTVNASAGYVDLFWKAQSLGCNTTGWTYVADIIGTETWGINLTAGITYYLMLDDENTTANTGTINIACPTPCSGTPVTLNMTDSFSDGWDGAEFRLQEAGGTIYGPYTLTTGASGTQSICLPNGCYRVILTEGDFPDEIGWSLTNGATTYASASAPNAAPFNTLFTIGGAICPPAPVNDLCVNAAVIDLGLNLNQTHTGTGIGSTNTIGLTQYSETWISIIVPCSGMNLSLSYCGNTPIIDNAYINLFSTCGANPTLTGATNWNYTTCANGSIALNWNNIPAGTYYYPILIDNIAWPDSYTLSIVGSYLSSPPTGSNTQTFCSSDNPTIASLIVTGTDIKWYYAASGGNSLPTSLGLSNGATYYASQTIGGVESNCRFAVTVTINPVPVSPAITGSTNLCWNGTTTLTPEYPTGGTITDVAGYRTHTFTTNGTLIVPAGFSGGAELLVVAGGGGGGSGRGGGGGAGGLLFNSNFTLTAGTTYTVTIGAGGAAETNGNNSVFGTITAIGGGRGGSHNGNSAVTTNNGQNGGSGGGAAINFLTSIFNGGTATTSQGNNGGTSGTAGNDNPRNTGGGGGFSEAGRAGSGGNATWTTGVSPKGGDGFCFPQFLSFGSNGCFAGGGGGSKAGSDRSSAPAGAGGQGGGGAGSATGTSSLNGVAGTSNTGGGGGGGDVIISPLTIGIGGAGGSGIIIVRYFIGTPTWSSQNTSIATVSSGVVTGGAPGGNTTIDYTVAGEGSCPSTTVSTLINVFGGQQISPIGSQCSGTQLNFEALPILTVSGTTISWTVSTPLPTGLTASTLSGNTNLFSTTFTNPTIADLSPTITVSQTIGALTCSRNFTPTIIAQPAVSLNCQNFCTGIATDIIATPSPAGTYTYNWTALPGGVTNPGNNSTVNTSTAGMYTVIATNTATNCASEATSCTIAVQNPPSINAISPP